MYRGGEVKFHLSTKTALGLFIFLVIFVIAQGAWWVVFMAQLADEKTDIAEQLGGSPELLQQVHQEEIRRQIMLGLEGSVFLLFLLGGIWLIYKTLVRTQHLRSRQQNFVMAVTHELKTPLASIKLYLDSLESQKIADERKKGILPRMRQDVERLEVMVENILEVGRFDRHAHPINHERVSLSDLLRSSVAALEDRPAELPRTISVEIEPDVPVLGDALLLRRAFNAVLDNAQKYHDGRAISIRVVLHRSDGRAVVSVEDGGIGLKRGDLAAIFERFYRAGDELTRTSPGSGLGLYLCREIVRAHGGEVRAYSEGPGQGTTVTISLPLEVNG
jgi:two-component system sensor histidine kinase CiaH